MVGLKSLNPSPPRSAPWCGAKILPHPCAGRSGEGWVKRGGAKLPSLDIVDSKLSNVDRMMLKLGWVELCQLANKARAIKFTRLVLSKKKFLRDPVWYASLNTCFQVLNNITHFFTHFFTHTYFFKN